MQSRAAQANGGRRWRHPGLRSLGAGLGRRLALPGGDPPRAGPGRVRSL